LPREVHIIRQVQWKNRLQEYGCYVNLEKTIYINNAPVIIDVYAEVEGKTFLIEIGDIQDKRKIALLKLYTRQKHNTIFIHEEYGENRIQQVLESINVYLHSPEYKQTLQDELIQKEIENRKRIEDKLEDKHNKRIQLFGLSIIVLVPAIVLAFFSPEIVGYWIGFWITILFVLPLMSALMLESDALDYVISLFKSLESTNEEDLR
jgi:hypothetical protein